MNIKHEIYTSEFLAILDSLGINDKNAAGFCGIGPAQFSRWKKKGKMPAKNFWAFQKELVVYFEKEKLRKLVMLKVIDKEFLKELIENEI